MGESKFFMNQIPRAYIGNCGSHISYCIYSRLQGEADVSQQVVSLDC